NSFLALVEHRPGFFLLIVLLYPLISALPQELLFRVLFFRRYDALLPKGPGRYLINGAIFSLAHLMFWSWVVAALTFIGGMIFSYAYERRGGFPQAALLHSVAGWMLFAMGMGAFFYLGNAHRPF
ncbi:CPBP family intramembrane metalloprotease, partial [Thioclava sp. BHET1]